MNLPNKLTVARMISVPAFVAVYLLFWNTPCRWIAFGLFIAASLTDLLDGAIARKRNLVTNFGKFMDPLADKLLVCSALICLSYVNLVPVWIVLIIVAREFIISGFRLIAVEQGLVLAASVFGKIKTVLTMVMICFQIANLAACPFCMIVGQILIYASLFFTILSLADYLWKNKGVLKGEK